VAHMFALRNAETGKVLENSSSPEFSFMFASGHDACADAISLNFCKVKPTKWNETCRLCVYIASSKRTTIPCRGLRSQVYKLNIFHCPIFLNYIAEI